MSISPVSKYNYTQAYKQAAVDKTAKANAVQESTDSGKSMLDKLKETFSNVNFVTGNDPFAGNEPKRLSKNTVYLDTAALRKLENDPRYAARVFSEIETSLSVFGNGVSYRDNNKTFMMPAGSTNLSFYGKTESSKSVAKSYAFATSGPINNRLLGSLGETEEEKTHRRINDLANKNYKTWADKFKVPVSERHYFDINEVLSKLQASKEGRLV